MYSPLQPGISNAHKDDVLYEEVPSYRYSRQVHCYWELEAKYPLDADFIYEVIPDGCVDIVFECGRPDSGIVMTPGYKTELINLGKSFHYVGIRLNIGYWKYPADVIDKQVALREFAVLQSVAIPSSFKNTDAVKQMDTVVGALVEAGCINTRPLSALLQNRINELRSVEDMMRVSGYSRRQLQRVLKEETGFLPKQLLAIIRFQSTLKQHAGEWRYSDQAHENRDFKQRTGMTPKVFRERFSRALSEIFNTRR